jgi:membrane protease YdiL (CAAX protease family)
VTVNWTRVAVYYGATFVLTHTLSLTYLLVCGAWDSPQSFAVANVVMLCPAVVAIGLQRIAGEPIATPLALRFRPSWWFLAAWLLPPLLMVAALAVSLLLPGARYAGDMGGLPASMDSFRQQVRGLGIAPPTAMLLIGLALGPTLSAIGGLGEEIGWRGFLYKELAPLGFWRCSWVTGVLWALWHVPLFFEGYGDRQHPVASGLGMAAFAVLLAPILAGVRRASGSVVACGILHGTLSSTRLFAVAFVRDAEPWAEAAVPAVLLLVDVALFAFGRRWWSVAPQRPITAPGDARTRREPGWRAT